MTAKSIPCVFARAGTSRGAFLLRSDLPTEQDALDRVVLAAYGSPDRRQIDGIGGGDALTSKVAVVAPSARPGADVDYTFGQVSVDQAQVLWVGNCGNMSAGVGPFAVRQGLVPAVAPVTRVRIYNTNTDKVLTAEVLVDDDGAVIEDGDTTIAGVPGTGAPISLDFGDCGGAVTGRLLPTGNLRDKVTLTDGRTIEISVVDASTPFVFVRATDVGLAGTETADQIDADPGASGHLEEVRTYAARALGMVRHNEVASVVSPSIPRVVAIASPISYNASDGTVVGADDVNVVARQMAMQRTHKTFAVTGTLCTAVASAIPGTVVNEVAAPSVGSTFRIGHPGGVIESRVTVDLDGPEITVREAALVRTSRVIMTGHLFVPSRAWSGL